MSLAVLTVKYIDISYCFQLAMNSLPSSVWLQWICSPLLIGYKEYALLFWLATMNSLYSSHRHQWIHFSLLISCHEYRFPLLIGSLTYLTLQKLNLFWIFHFFYGFTHTADYYSYKQVYYVMGAKACPIGRFSVISLHFVGCIWTKIKILTWIWAGCQSFDLKTAHVFARNTLVKINCETKIFTLFVKQ